MCLLGTEKGWWQSWLGFPTTPREKSFIPVGEGSKGSILLSFWKEKCYQSSLLLGAGFEGSTPGKTNNGGGWGGRWKQSSMTFQQPQTSPSRVRWGGFSWGVDLGTSTKLSHFSSLIIGTSQVHFSRTLPSLFLLLRSENHYQPPYKIDER